MKLLAVLVLVLVVVTLLEVEGSWEGGRGGRYRRGGRGGGRGGGRKNYYRRISTASTSSPETGPTTATAFTCPPETGQPKLGGICFDPDCPFCSGNDQQRKQNCSCDGNDEPIISCGPNAALYPPACQGLVITRADTQLLNVDPFDYHFIDMTFAGEKKYCVEFKVELNADTQLDMFILPPRIAQMDKPRKERLIDCYSDMTPTETSPCLPCKQGSAFQFKPPTGEGADVHKIVKIQPGCDFIIGFIFRPVFADDDFQNGGRAKIYQITIKNCTSTY